MIYKRKRVQKMNDFYNPREDGILAFNKNELTDETGMEIERQLLQLLEEPKGSAFHQLQAWKKLGKKLHKFMKNQNDIIQASVKESQRIYGSTTEKKYKRWTPEEENTLIELVTQPDMTLVQLSTMFGRTPSAIQAKLTNLVGLKRVDRRIAGKFVGNLNGEHVEGFVDGIIN
jgi:hypothetical protein